MVNLERLLAIVGDPLKSIGLAAERSPTAIGLTDHQAAIGCKGQAVNSALEAATEGKTCTLINAVHFFEGHPHDHRLGLVTHETLPSEWAEFAAGRIPNRFAGGLTHAPIGEPDAGRVNIGVNGRW